MAASLSHLLTPVDSSPTPHHQHPEWLAWRYGKAQAQINTWLEQAIESSWQAQRPLLTQDTGLDLHLPRLWQATRHATVLGGKRIRPLLSLLVWQALGQSEESPLKGICLSSEFMHAQSLVFDDLPCMDNDDFRRGNPTTHKAFDEATAVLVGDALACFAFECLIQYSPQKTSAQLEALVALTQFLGGVGSFKGLVNGQYADMWSASSPSSMEALRYIHAHKTGALLRYAVVAPALLAGVTPPVKEGLSAWAEILGQLFQATDDLLDATACSETLGKTAGKDAEQNKLTYVSLLGLEGTQAELLRLHEAGLQVLADLKPHGLHVEALTEIQAFILQRGH
jgi:geranylgeranyl pyrophosphate synthase